MAQRLEDELGEEPDISLVAASETGISFRTAAPPNRWNEGGYVHAEDPSGRELRATAKLSRKTTSYKFPQYCQQDRLLLPRCCRPVRKE
jgi:hypothetical protein